MSAFMVGVVFDSCGEEGVDEGSLSQARFASHLEISAQLLQNSKRGGTMIVNAAPLFATILCLPE